MRVFKYEVRLLIRCPSLPNTFVYISYTQNILQQNRNTMYPFPRAVITEYHKLEGLKQQKFTFSRSGGWKSEIKVSAEVCFLWRLQGIISLAFYSSSWLQEFLGFMAQFSRSVMSDSLWPHGLQHARPPCPSPAPGVKATSLQFPHPSSHGVLLCVSSLLCVSYLRTHDLGPIQVIRMILSRDP